MHGNHEMMRAAPTDNPCRNGHHAERDKYGKCRECKRMCNKMWRDGKRQAEAPTSFIQGIPREFSRQREAEKAERDARLAAVRAQKAAHQRQLAYRVPV